MLAAVDPKRARNYELTVASRSTKLAALLEPLSSKGTSQSRHGLIIGPGNGFWSDDDKIRRLYTLKTGKLCQKGLAFEIAFA
jgi:hypothetical protein